MRKLIVMFLAVLLTLALVCACQPTPDTPPVASKNDGKLNSAISDGAEENYVFEAPKTFDYKDEKTVEGVSFELSADAANVNLPKNSGFSVYRGTVCDISAQMLEKIITNLASNATLYEHTDVLTKSEITTKYLVPYKQLLFEMENGLYDFSQESMTSEDDDTPIDVKNYYINGLKNRIAATETQITKAPDEKPNKVVTVNDYKPGYDFNIDLPLQNQKTARISIIAADRSVKVSYGDYEIDESNFSDTSGCNLEKNIDSYMGIYCDTKLRLDEFKDASASVSEVKSTAQGIIDAIGLSNDFTLSCVSTGRLRTDASDNFLFMAGNMPVYAVIFTRNIDGVSVWERAAWQYHTGMEMPDPDDPSGAYSPQFCYESACVYISKSGEVMGYTYKGALKLERVNSQVKLLEFDEAKDRVIKGMSSFYVSPDSNISCCQRKLLSMDLKYFQVREKDNNDAFLLVPVWISDYSYKTVMKDGNEEFSTPMGYYYSGTLINALDGSSIDYHLGF